MVQLMSYACGIEKQQPQQQKLQNDYLKPFP